MKKIARRVLFAFVLMVVLPAAAYAQASIAGVIRDTSGAVLPGVTVEAASPVLIERTRSVVSDGAGQFRIVDLRPGTYVVTFTLAGFNTVKREGVELAGSFAATLTVEMRVGALEETVTVTGDSPVVDIQNTRVQRVVDRDTLNALPTSRTSAGIGAITPGVNVGTLGGADVGGTGSIGISNLTSHGSRTGDSRGGTVEGLSSANNDLTGNSTATLMNSGAVQEVTLDNAALSAEIQTGGVTVNVIPRQGGNTFSGSFFGTGTNENLIGSNYTADLKARGLTAPNAVKKIAEVTPAMGGPLLQDRLWFFTSLKWAWSDNWVAGLQNNLNAGKPGADGWLYVRDPNTPPIANERYSHSFNGRLTWQASPRDKLSFYYDDQMQCTCPNYANNVSPESGGFNNGWPRIRFMTATWTSPLTSRLLAEVGTASKSEGWHSKYRTDFADPDAIAVTEQSTGMVYHGPALQAGNFNLAFPELRSHQFNMRASLTYVTGAHAFKVGMDDRFGNRHSYSEGNASGLAYRFNNGVPNLLTETAGPIDTRMNLDADFGLYAQERWTIGRYTLNMGLRFDYFSSSYPQQTLGPSVLAPTRNITFPEGKVIDGWKDLSPRLGLAYDIFGNGKTAAKVTLSRYVLGNALQSTYGDALNPVARTAYTITRPWTDADTDFVPDCDLTNPRANGECGVGSDLNFGNSTATTTYDQALLTGWASRPYNWEFSTSIQHEVVPRVAVNVGYFRRWFGNFLVTDNRATVATDYTPFSITRPVNSRLPDGGGSVISGLRDLNPNKVGLVDNFLTFASNYGKQIEHWNGVDVTVNARLDGGVTVQGGLSTGRTLTDTCAVIAALPEAGLLTAPYCHTVTNFLTQVKASAVYTVPAIDVQLSGVFQSLPGPEISANYVATNAIVAPSLGRNLSAGSNVVVNLVPPGTLYGERINQLDLRIGKVLRLGRSRAVVGIDIYNALNVNPVTTENANYASWRVPTSILTGRFAKFSVQFDF